ncbi:hypothetical protein N657DRAFT_641457, partial [Parathielavia appendiculata]
MLAAGLGEGLDISGQDTKAASPETCERRSLPAKTSSYLPYTCMQCLQSTRHAKTLVTLTTPETKSSPTKEASDRSNGRSES